MPDRRHPYFAYGSNLCAHQMASRCPDAGAPRPAVLSDHNWLINQRGVATVEPFAGNKVHGVLWQLSERDLVRLDSAEGVPVRYRRERLTVHTDDTALPAWVYIDHRVMPAGRGRAIYRASSTALDTTGCRNAGSTICTAGTPRGGPCQCYRHRDLGLRHNHFRSC